MFPTVEASSFECSRRSRHRVYQGYHNGLYNYSMVLNLELRSANKRILHLCLVSDMYSEFFQLGGNTGVDFRIRSYFYYHYHVVLCCQC
jgi:hypothetical protein